MDGASCQNSERKLMQMDCAASDSLMTEYIRKLRRFMNCYRKWSELSDCISLDQGI